MNSTTITLLHRQLETTLRLLVSASSSMSTDDLIVIRVRLTEADLLLGSVMVERDTAVNNNSAPHPSENAPSTETAHNTDSASGNLSPPAPRDTVTRRRAPHHPGTRTTAHGIPGIRPITRSTPVTRTATRNIPIRAQASRNTRNAPTLLIDMESDDD